MDRFGTQAAVLVTLLLSAGIWLAIQLVVFEGYLAPYMGKLFLLKCSL